MVLWPLCQQMLVLVRLESRLEKEPVKVSPREMTWPRTSKDWCAKRQYQYHPLKSHNFRLSPEDRIYHGLAHDQWWSREI